MARIARRLRATPFYSLFLVPILLTSFALCAISLLGGCSGTKVSGEASSLNNAAGAACHVEPRAVSEAGAPESAESRAPEFCLAPNELGAQKGKVQSILATAYSQMGRAYHWAGTSPESGFDCSGFVQWVFSQNGIKLPRTSWEQINAGKRISKSDLKPGDLVLYSTRWPHVGIYTGEGKYIHSPVSGDHVREVEAFDGYSRMVAAARIVSDPDAAPLDADKKQAIVQKAMAENFRAPRRAERAVASLGRETGRGAESPGALHTIKSGDTLGGVASRYRVPVRRLLAANNLKENQTLSIGQRLVIPGLAPAPAAPQTVAADSGRAPAEAPSLAAASGAYVVRGGDTPAAIAGRLGVGLDQLLAANNLKPSSMLSIGQKLAVPGTKPQPNPSARDMVAEKAAPPQTAPPQAASFQAEAAKPERLQARSTRLLQYEIRKGDTLGGLAGRHGLSVEQLLAANNLKENHTLSIGQKVIIPKAAQDIPSDTRKEEAVAPGPKAEPTASAASAASSRDKKPAAKAAEKSSAAPALAEYMVQKGDTLSAVASRHGITPDKLVAANNLKNKDSLSIGQKLVIPKP